MSRLSKLSRNKRTERQRQRTADQPRRTEINRQRQRLKHLRRHPNDKTASIAKMKELENER